MPKRLSTKDFFKRQAPCDRQNSKMTPNVPCLWKAGMLKTIPQSNVSHL